MAMYQNENDPVLLPSMQPFRPSIYNLHLFSRSLLFFPFHIVRHISFSFLSFFFSLPVCTLIDHITPLWMKFAKCLETDSIPEWRKAYINYKGLKKRLRWVDKVGFLSLFFFYVFQNVNNLNLLLIVIVQEIKWTQGRFRIGSDVSGCISSRRRRHRSSGLVEPMASPSPIFFIFTTSMDK